MQDDIVYFEKIMSLDKRIDLFNNYFCWIYPFTNENINGYYSKIDFKDKNVLTPTSSGDHILNAILLGASEIDSFDINPIAKYYVELKIAAIKTLSLDNFLLFFYYKGIMGMKDNYLNKETYMKIRENLSGNYLLFWDYVFKKYSPKQLYKSSLFTDDFLSINALLEANKYLNGDEYNKLREKLSNMKVQYYDIDLQDLTSINKRFDIIILSNIPSYLDKIYESKQLKKFKELINKIKYSNTKVVVNYMYYNLLWSANLCDDNYENIYNDQVLREYFPKNEYEYINFISADNLGRRKILKKCFPKVDKVFVSRDK